MTPPDDHTRAAPAPDTAGATVTSHPADPDNESTQAQQSSPTQLLNSTGLPVVPGYVVAHELARGGMGVVYAAHDPTFDREVAVKVMHPGQDAGRFVIESKVTARLPHPGVPPVYALGTLADGRPFLAMKLIEGRTLADELKASGPSDLPRLVGAFEHICQAVGFAHSKGIIHRDLKPANVMVGAFGEVQVMDWGLARAVSGGQQSVDSEDNEGSVAIRRGASAGDETQAGQVKGTPAYMAPEQARGEPVDARADVFALGGILAATLTGKPPFAGHTVMDTVLKAALAELGECFAQLDGCGADAGLVAVAKRCLAAEPAVRYANGEAVAAAVAAYRAGVEERLRRAERDRAAAEAKAAEEVNTRREAEARAAEQRKRRRVQQALAAAVVLLLAAGGAFAWWQDKQAGERKLADQRADADHRETEARLQAEQRFKGEQARQGIDAGLKLATDLRKQYKFKAAGAALAQAAELAAGGAPERIAEVEQARAALAFVVHLDNIRFRKWSLGTAPASESNYNEGDFNVSGAVPEYRAAFAARGLDLTSLDPAEAGRRIAASAVSAELIAAVDDWALYERDPGPRDRLLEVARRADPGPWTDRLRDPLVRVDKAAVARLAADADAGARSTASLSVLATLMMRLGLDPAPTLSAARARHPTDFELAFALGLWYMDSLDGRQIGPYEAARAIRPDNQPVWTNLGAALQAKGDVGAAVAAFREAVRLDPADPKAHSNLGVALEAKGDVDGAVAAFKEAIRIDPKLVPAHYNLGRTLQAKGDVDGAVAAYREAVRLAPRFAQAHNNLAGLYHQQRKYPEAVASARAATQADPKLPTAHALLAFALQQSGDAPGARAALAEAARLDPKRYGPMLAKAPAVPVAPPPREVKR